MGVVHHIINEERHAEHGGVAKDDTLPVVEEKVEGQDDDDVAIENDPPHRHRAIFVDNGSDDVGSTRRTLVHEDDAQAYAAGSASQHTCHKALPIAHQHWQLAIVHLEELLQRPEDDGKHRKAINRLDAKAQPKNTYGKDNQNDVNHEIGDLHFHSS